MQEVEMCNMVSGVYKGALSPSVSWSFLFGPSCCWANNRKWVTWVSASYTAIKACWFPVFPTPPYSLSLPTVPALGRRGQAFLYSPTCHPPPPLSVSLLSSVWASGNSASPHICVTWAGRVDLLGPHWQLTLFIPGQIELYLALITYWSLLALKFGKSTTLASAAT